MFFRKKSIAPYCEEIDSKNQECSLEGLSANICGLEKYWDELAPWYQVDRRLRLRL